MHKVKLESNKHNKAAKNNFAHCDDTSMFITFGV